MEHSQLAETAAQVECHSRLVAVVIHLCQKSKTLRWSAASIQAQTKAHSYEVAVPDIVDTSSSLAEAITAKVRRDRETSQPFQARLESFQRSIGMPSKDNIAFRVRGQYSDECGSTGVFRSSSRLWQVHIHTAFGQMAITGRSTSVLNN